MTELSLFGCKKIRVVRSSPHNANAITLMIERGNSRLESVELLLFDLPSAVTDKLLLAFRDEETSVYVEPIKSEEAAA